MELFRRIFFAAVLSGAAAGLVNAGLQQWRVVPLILEAETYEGAGHSHGDQAVHAHEDGTEHVHEAEAIEDWAPADGWERTGYTVLATVLAGIGFALTLGAVSVLTGLAITPTNGLLWGLAGFAAFSLAPALGLPPELPGMAAADLTARQMWWWGAALSTGLAAYVIARFKSWPAISVAAILFVTPHIIGAPQAPETLSDLPAHLATAFASNALGIALVFWLICGSLFGWISQRNLSKES